MAFIKEAGMHAYLAVRSGAFCFYYKMAFSPAERRNSVRCMVNGQVTELRIESFEQGVGWLQSEEKEVAELWWAEASELVPGSQFAGDEAHWCILHDWEPMLHSQADLAPVQRKCPYNYTPQDTCVCYLNGAALPQECHAKLFEEVAPEKILHPLSQH